MPSFSHDSEQNKEHCVGLNEETIRFISKVRNEPAWLLDFRLKAYTALQTMSLPQWANINYSFDINTILFYNHPTKNRAIRSLQDIDPKILEIYTKLGISLEEQNNLAGIAVDAVFDSSSLITTYKKQLAKYGIIFCSFQEAVVQHESLVRAYLATVVPPNDNYFACLNSAVFSDGSFVYIPSGVHCPIDITSYFRINTQGLGQFERTLIIAESGASVRYLEGCSAPQFLEQQLHAAVVEIIVHDDAAVDYATVQNWYAGNEKGEGGVLNFVTKRGLCKGDRSRISWTQFETGSAATWKYPSCILAGDQSVGEFFSLTITHNFQQADTGTKMIHLGKNTKSRIISKSIAGGNSKNTFRSKVILSPNASNSKNYSSCDSLIFGSHTETITDPVLRLHNTSSVIEHEAKSGKIDATIIEYLMARGLTEEAANNLVIAGYAREVIAKLPLEFAMEARQLLQISFENSVG